MHLKNLDWCDKIADFHMKGCVRLCPKCKALTLKYIRNIKKIVPGSDAL